LRQLAFLVPSLLAVLAGASLLLAQSGSPGIQVSNGGVIPPGGTVNFPNTAMGVASPITFTVTNTGSAPLLVGEVISVPQGFTLMANFPGVPNALFGPNTNVNSVPAYTIAPSATATFTVALNSATPGTFTGPVSFATNVTGTNPFTFTVTGTVTGTSSTTGMVSYSDDNDQSFSATSGWVADYTAAGTSGAVPFEQYLAWANPTPTPGTPTETATWTFTGLSPGQYKVAASWVGYSWGATNTPITVCDGATPLSTVTVNQTADSSGFNDGGSNWQNLGTFTITGTTLVAKMTNDCNSYPNADGLRIERVGFPGAIIDDSQTTSGFSTASTDPNVAWHPGYTQTPAGSPAVDFQGTETWADLNTGGAGNPTATATWTFSNVTPGTYRVLAGFNGYSWGTTNAPYTVLDGTTALGTVRVNQSVTPTDIIDAGNIGWKHLGFFTITGNTLVVKLTNDCDSWPNADAVRIQSTNPAAIATMADTVRLLEQASWGPTPALITQVQGTGLATWVNQQFTAPASGYPTLPLYSTNDNITNNVTTSCYGDPTVSGNPARTACLRDHYSMYPLQNTFFTNALYQSDQLRQRMAWALHKIWVISGIDVRQSAWVAPYLQVLYNNAFGNYRTLMYQVTLNAGMGDYLNMDASVKASPNENYPREIMQLFAFGLNELNPDGSNKLDSSMPPQFIPTYDQTLVNNMTKVFTGWKFAPAVSSGVPNYIDPMRLNGLATETATNHDFTQKNLLRGFQINAQPAAGQTVANAYAELNAALDNMYNQPSFAPFISKQLIQQLVTSNPSPAYVARVTDTFTRNRTSPNQLREVLRAILLDPEARGDSKTATNYGHLREPVLYINNLMRMFNAASDDLTQNSDGYLNPSAVTLGQDVFRPPSVFSYFSPGKVAVGGNPPVFGPETQLLNTTTSLAAANFVNQAFMPNSSRTIDVVRAHGTSPSGTDPATGLPLVPTGPLGTAVDVSFLLPYASDPAVLTEQLNQLMMHGTMNGTYGPTSPSGMKGDIWTAVNAVAASNSRKRVHTAIYLVASSAQYQVQQ
jgi:uncharacterized protein (DUF1800 family)